VALNVSPSGLPPTETPGIPEAGLPEIEELEDQIVFSQADCPPRSRTEYDTIPMFAPLTVIRKMPAMDGPFITRESEMCGISYENLEVDDPIFADPAVIIAVLDSVTPCATRQRTNEFEDHLVLSHAELDTLARTL